MKHPLPLWVLLIWLVFLAFGGLYDGSALMAVQVVMIGFSAGIQYVMVVNGWALSGFGAWPSFRNAYCEDNQ